MTSKKALVLLAEGFEEIEALTVVDVLRRAGVETVMASLEGKTVKGSHGIEVNTDVEFKDAGKEYDALILPGGQPGTNNLASSDMVISFIKKFNSAGKIVAAICAASAIVLSKAGVLEDKSATCYPGLEKKLPQSTKYKKRDVVADSNIITSRGPGTAMIFALKIVKELLDKDSSKKLAESLLC